MNTKRNIQRAAVAAMLVVLGCQEPAGDEPGQEPLSLEGMIVVNVRDDVTIHTYVAPEESWLVTSHIIETEESLVIIDPQLFLPHAQEVRAYAESLDKPIDRLFITHGHSDHTLGAAVFDDLPIYSTATTRDVIEQEGPQNVARIAGFYGDELVADESTVPTAIVSDGSSEVIDGLVYEYEVVTDAEDGDQLLIRLPAIGTLVAQDLLYNDAHLFLGENAFDGWSEALTALRGDPGYDLFLVGHGHPTNDPAIVDANLEYLGVADEAFAEHDTPAEIQAVLLERYPYYGAAALLAGVNFALGVFE